MNRWHKLSLLLLAVMMVGLSGCQSAIRTDDLSNGPQTPLGKIEDGKDEIWIQMPGDYAVWQSLRMQSPSNTNFIDIVEWSFKTDIYPANLHTWNTLYASRSGIFAGPWHMQNSWIELYEPGGSARVSIELGFVLRKGDLSSGHWAWYQIFKDDGSYMADHLFRNCRTTSIQTVRGWVNRLWRNADGTWTWMIFLQCNDGASTVTFNTRAFAIRPNPSIWAEWEANECPTNKPYAWKSDKFSGSTIVYFRSVFYAYVPKGTDGTRTTVNLNANNFDTGHSSGGNTNCISTMPVKRQLSNGRIAIDW